MWMQRYVRIDIVVIPLLVNIVPEEHGLHDSSPASLAERIFDLRQEQVIYSMNGDYP
jgi:hypothetical protein